MSTERDNIWIYSWNEPRLFAFDATVVLLLPLLLFTLFIAEVGAWILVRPFAILFMLLAAYEIYVAFVLKTSVVVSLAIIRMKLLGRVRPAVSAINESYVYDPHGMSGWRARLFQEQNGD